MYFDDGFDISDENLQETIMLSMLRYLIFQQEKPSKKDKIIFTSSLVEYALKHIGISNFDFINNTNIIRIETALREAIERLERDKVLLGYMQEAEEFYKFFIRKQLFKKEEFSNSFEQSFIEKLLYKMDVLLKYVLVGDAKEFYEIHKINKIVIESKKVLTIYIDKPVKVLAMVGEVEEYYFIKANKLHNYSEIADYCAFYNTENKSILVYSTSLKNKKSGQHKKVAVMLNADTKLKLQFM